MAKEQEQAEESLNLLRKMTMEETHHAAVWVYLYAIKCKKDTGTIPESTQRRLDQLWEVCPTLMQDIQDAHGKI